MVMIDDIEVFYPTESLPENEEHYLDSELPCLKINKIGEEGQV
jgi:hypothetical protein